MLPAVLQAEVIDLELCSLPVESDSTFIGAVHLFHSSIKLHHFVAIVIPQNLSGCLSDAQNPLDLLPLKFIYQRLSCA